MNTRSRIPSCSTSVVTPADGVGNSLRASSPIWESEASRARRREWAGPHAFASPLARLLFTLSPSGELARRLNWWMGDQPRSFRREDSYFFPSCLFIFLFHCPVWFLHAFGKEYLAILRSLGGFNGRSMCRAENSFWSIGRKSAKIIAALSRCNIDSKLDSRRQIAYN